MRRLLLLAPLPFAVAACGAGGSQYAQMSRYDAMQEVDAVAAGESADRTGPLYRHRLRFARLVRGRNSAGEGAWVGEFVDSNGGRRVCFTVWTTHVGIVTTVHSDAAVCGPARQTGTPA